MNKFVLPYDITVNEENGMAWLDSASAGLIEQFTDGQPDVAARAASDAMESLVLALASAGVDVASPEFIKGFVAAVESVAQRLDDYVEQPAARRAHQA